MNRDIIATSEKIILASASPRRIEFLKKWGFNFISKKSSFPERTLPTPEKTVLYNSYGKAFDIAKVNKNYIVIGVDTVVALENEILGKPINKEKVKEMLYKLSDKTHTVISGITIMHKNKFLTDICKTFVTFRKLGREEIESYAETGEGKDKAGGYAVQGLASDFIIKIEGYVDNVIGLPVNNLRKLLNQI
jgi:septum formation protein